MALSLSQHAGRIINYANQGRQAAQNDTRHFHHTIVPVDTSPFGSRAEVSVLVIFNFLQTNRAAIKQWRRYKIAESNAV